LLELRYYYLLFAYCAGWDLFYMWNVREFFMMLGWGFMLREGFFGGFCLLFLCALWLPRK